MQYKIAPPQKNILVEHVKVLKGPIRDFILPPDVVASHCTHTSSHNVSVSIEQCLFAAIRCSLTVEEEIRMHECDSMVHPASKQGSGKKHTHTLEM